MLAGEDTLGGLERSLCAFNGGLYGVRAACQIPLFGPKPVGLAVTVIAICGAACAGFLWIAIHP